MPQLLDHRPFAPGTTGWTLDDLNDPTIQRSWSEGRYELVDGVLTMMAPQGLHGVGPLSWLRRIIERHVDRTGQGGIVHHEVDLHLRHGRLARPDMLFLTREQCKAQEQKEKELGILRADYCPILITPLLVVESVSLKHEDHDRLTKREWYAQAGIPHYWLLTAHEQSLVALKLQGDQYIEEATGAGSQTLSASLFGGITIPLAELWN
jgi:Uma2 family endonuclease